PVRLHAAGRTVNLANLARAGNVAQVQRGSHRSPAQRPPQRPRRSMRPSRLIRRAALAATLFSTAFSQLAVAQRGGRGADTTGGRGAGLPLTPTKALKFTTDEGTWLELDLSPDGGTIVFELLGDIYTIPAEGGKATRITSGQPFDAQPH